MHGLREPLGLLCYFLLLLFRESSKGVVFGTNEDRDSSLEICHQGKGGYYTGTHLVETPGLTVPFFDAV